MERLKIERIGGLAGFGLPGSRLTSKGDLALTDLSESDRSAVDALFDSPVKPRSMPDGFRYRITRQTPKGPKTVEVTEDRVPMSVRNSVKDELK